MLEKPGVQNLEVYENQGKKHKSRVMEKENYKGWCENDKTIDWNTSFSKRFYIRKRK